MSFKIIFFNHKGGVSKTTTTYHIGWMLASEGYRVLLVDGDPQCNLTALILKDRFDEYYFEESTRFNNIKDGVKVAFEGKPALIEPVECIQADRQPNLYLLPGHADLSEYDAALSLAQTSNGAISALQNLPGAFNYFIEKTAEKYNADFVLIDLNPGLSAINQSLFNLSDGFIIPTNPDPFSVMALQTLSRVLPRWTEWAVRMRPLFENAAYPLPITTPRLIGTLIQRFNVRKGVAARPYRDNIQELKDTVRNVLRPQLMKSEMLFNQSDYDEAGIGEDYCLAEIPDFQGLLPKSHDVGVPVFAISDAELGVTGMLLNNMKEKKEEFNSLFKAISGKILSIEKNAERLQPVFD